MFRWLINSSLQFRYIVVAAAAALAIGGTYRLPSLSVSVFPEFAPPMVEVQTEALGLSASEVESLVTLNVEELLAGVPWLTSMRSKSVTGLSSIELTFERGTDVMRARQMVQERLTMAYALPNVSKPPTILQPLSVTNRVMMVGISSDKIDPADLSLISRWTMKPALLGVPGVANVAIWGQRLRQMHVHFDPERLRDARVAQEDIIAAAGDSLWVTPLSFLKGSTPGTGGWVDNANQRLGIHHEQPIRSPEDMARVPLSAQHLVMAGKSMDLGDVAEVTESHPLVIGDAMVNSANGLMLVIEQFPGADTLEVTRGIDKILSQLSLGLPGVKMDASVYRLSWYIDEAMDNLVETLAISGLLASAIIGLLMMSWRAALVSVIAIPLSLLAAVHALNLLGFTTNTMILAGFIVALAVIIDDVVVDMDGVSTRLAAADPGKSSVVDVVMQAVSERRSTIMFAAAMILLALSPIFFMGGFSGAFFEPLGAAYVSAMLISTLIALTLTPALLVLLARGRANAPAESPFKLRRLFGATLERAMAARGAVLGGLAAVLVVAVAASTQLGQSLLPSLKERELTVSWTTPPGTSRIETYRVTSRLADELRSLSGVRSVSAHIGRAITGDQVVGINSGQIWVALDLNADYETMAARVREVVDGYPGIDRNVQSYLRNKVSQVLTGSTKPIVVRVFGKERERLKALAEEVRVAMSRVSGLTDLQVEGQEEEPQIKVKVDLAAAGLRNVRPGDVRRSSATVFSGLEVGYLFEEQKIYDVVVWGAPEKRQSINDLQDLWVERPNRTHVRLSEIANVTIEPVPTLIRHERISPYIDVTANVLGRDLSTVTREVAARLNGVTFPVEYYPELLGEYSERKAVEQRILGISIAAAIGVFLLLQACFRSWTLAGIGFLALPVAAAGGVLAIAVTGATVTMGSLVGFLAALGIAARYGVMLIREYQRLEAENIMAFGRALVIAGTQNRLRPIITSSAAVLSALLPFVVLGPISGLEIVQPMAVVALGALVVTTIYTLIVLPVLYLALAGRANRQHDLGLATA